VYNTFALEVKGPNHEMSETTTQQTVETASERHWRAPVLYSIAYLLFWQIAPRFHDDRIGAVILATIISLVLVVLITASAARSMRTTWAALLTALITAAIVLPLRIQFAAGVIVAPWIWILFIPGLADLTFVLFGAAFGVLLSRLLRSANMVPPAAAALALVDIWTVLLGGPVQRVMTSTSASAQRVAQAMTVQLPAPTSGAAPIAVVGFADFVFMAFFVGAMCRFLGDAIGYSRTIGPMAAVLALYMVVVLLTGWSLPALLPMALVVIAVHWRRFHYERSEIFALLYAGLLLLALMAGSVWLTQR